MISSIIDFINAYIFGPGLCVAVLLGGILLTLYLRPFYLTKPKKILSALTAKANNGGMSPMRAMIVALAGTLGVGNIAGVASAIAIGGPGAVFFMAVSAVAALPLKYAEIVLAVRHRRRDNSGKPHGGAYFYMADKGTKAAKTIAVIFALLCVGASFTMGCATQANAIAVSVKSALRIPPVVCGIILALFTYICASGGLDRIAFLTTKLIPLMSGIYIIMCLYVIFANLTELRLAVADILTSAFDPRSIGGGFMGFVTSRALRIGVTRGIVSNEAGSGTAPIAHAGAEVRSPAMQGVWGIFEVFIDTIVICTLTAFVVLISGKYGVIPTLDGMATAIEAFERFIPFGGELICVSIVVFAFCTMICWFYYGTEAMGYMGAKIGDKKRKNAVKLYLTAYSLCALFGAVSSAGVVWSLSDLFVSIMTALNLSMVLTSAKEVKIETDNFFYADSRNKTNIRSKFK